MLVLQGKTIQRQCGRVAEAVFHQGPVGAEREELLLLFSVLSADDEKSCIKVQTCSSPLGCWLFNHFHLNLKTHTDPERFIKWEGLL